MLHESWQAETRKSAGTATDRFVATYEAKYPKAADCLARDRETLLAFYDFPAAHWQHLRTTTPWDLLLPVDHIPASGRAAGADSRVDRWGNGPSDASSIHLCIGSVREDFARDLGHFLLALPQQVDFVWCQHPGSGRGTEPPIE